MKGISNLDPLLKSDKVADLDRRFQLLEIGDEEKHHGSVDKWHSPANGNILAKAGDAVSNKDKPLQLSPTRLNLDEADDTQIRLMPS